MGGGGAAHGVPLTRGLPLGTKDASVSGERRPVRAFPQELAWRSEADALVLEFTLGAGTYGTALLRELMKTADLDSPALAAESE